MAEDWIGISSAEYDSHCGDDGSAADIEDALDGNGKWEHTTLGADHWFILDLGQSYTITKLRGRSNYDSDPTDIDIYVSETNGVWGDAVATAVSTWQDTESWVEVDTTDKAGRYVYIYVNSTEHAADSLTWGKFSTPFMTIIDVYGEAVGVAGLPDADVRISTTKQGQDMYQASTKQGQDMFIQTGTY